MGYFFFPETAGCQGQFFWGLSLFKQIIKSFVSFPVQGYKWHGHEDYLEVNI